MPKTRTKKQYESHGLITQNQQHDLSECYRPRPVLFELQN